MEKGWKKLHKRVMGTKSERTYIRKFLAFTFLGCFVVFLFTCSRQGAKRAEERPTLEVYFLDVGQGDSTLIRDASGKAALVDSGPSGDSIVPMLQNLGVSKFSLVIGTHPDADHIGSMKEVLEAFPAEVYMDPQIPHTTQFYLNLLLTLKSLVEAKKTVYWKPEGQRFLLGDTVLEIFPSPNPPFEDSNNNSVVVRVVYGEFALLLTGDAEAEEEGWLLSHFDSPFLKAQVLKVAHHGSHSGTTEAFLSGVQPEVGIISVGKGNPYGHPHKEVLDRLEKKGIAVFRTDEEGSLQLLTRGEGYEIRGGGHRLFSSPRKFSVNNAPPSSIPYFTTSCWILEVRTYELASSCREGVI